MRAAGLLMSYSDCGVVLLGRAVSCVSGLLCVSHAELAGDNGCRRCRNSSVSIVKFQ
jgi:hypothetical protein